MPSGAQFGQTTRFDNSFNPAISLMADVIADFVAFDGPTNDGVDLNLRRVDVLLADWIDPSAYIWTTIAYEEEEIRLDEAAIEYVALPGNHTVRAGRFFVDFGKQMQAHIEQIRTIDRPLVLRDYLGEELGAEGLQWDSWSSMGDETLMRYSVGAFTDISGGGHAHGGEIDEGTEIHVADRKGAEDFGFTGRLTALTEIGDYDSFQVGASVRLLPSFAFESEASELELAGQSNVVYGVDVTYGWVAADGIKSWTVGAEVLMFDGDLSAELDDNGTPGDITDDSLVVFNDQVFGSYAFVDRGWSQRDSAGLQFSTIEEPEVGTARVSELDVYYTRRLSEFLRLRFGATLRDVEGGEDSARLAIQLTGFIGPHGHGLNW